MTPTTWHYTTGYTITRLAPRRPKGYRRQRIRHITRKPIRGDTVFTNSEEITWLRR